MFRFNNSHFFIKTSSSIFFVIDTQYRSQPKKTLAQAKSDFEKVNSRESFVKAMKDNEEFMQNADILSTCKDLATKYPNPNPKKQ